MDGGTIGVLDEVCEDQYGGEGDGELLVFEDGVKSGGDVKECHEKEEFPKREGVACRRNTLHVRRGTENGGDRTRTRQL